MHAQDRGLEFNYDCIIINWIVIGLNLTEPLKCLLVTFAMIWCCINTAELKLN